MAEVKQRLRVLLAAEGDFPQRMTGLLKDDERVELVGTAADGERAAALFGQCRPALAVLDAELPLVDGLTAAARIRKLDRQAGIMLMSTFTGAQVQAACKTAGIDRMLPKPVRPEALCELLRIWEKSAFFRADGAEAVELERQALKILQDFGVKISTKSRKYLVEAVCLRACTDGAMTKVIYPEIAKKYGSKRENVEHVLRHAVHKIWKECDPAILAEYFGEAYVSRHESIGNDMFCSALAEHLRMERTDE